MITIEILDEIDNSWNKLLTTKPYGTIYQTKEYAEYLEIRLKLKPLFLNFLNNNGEISGQLLAFESLKGKSKIENSLGKKLFSKHISKISKFLPKKIIWSFGPVVFDASFENDILYALANWLKSKNYDFRGTFHPLNQNYILPENFGFHKQKTGTFIIDLKYDLDYIFKKSDKKSVQKNIKRSIERGVTVTPMISKNDLMIYYEMQKTYRKENKNTSYEINDITEEFRLLSPLGYEGFIAWYEKIPVGTISFSCFNGYINESGIARTQIDFEKKLYSQDLLRWKIIEWGKEHNCYFYDMSGVKPENRTPKEEGIFRNKKKWGGQQYDYWISTS